jgi:LCP family protein required for cell wall assembly
MPNNKKRRYLFYIVGFILFGILLSVPLLGRLSLAASPKNRVAIVKAPSGSTPTATAFQPLESTSTYFPTDYPTPLPSLTPTPANIIPSLNTGAVDPIIQPEGQISILLLGSDQKYKGSIGRTDSIMLLTINTQDGTVNLTSFPRDLYIYIPGWTNQRINTAFAHGGFELMQQTLLYNFGFKPDYYILVNLWAFEYIVNDLGGIYVNVPRTICDDKWGKGQSHCVYPGNKLMYGREALWYVRSRETSNDFDRNFRQQLVLRSMLNRLFSLDTIGRLPELFETYRNNVTTNLDAGTIISLTPLAAQLNDNSRLNQYFIGEDKVNSWITPGGAQVLLPNYQAIRKILEKSLNTP